MATEITSSSLVLKRLTGMRGKPLPGLKGATVEAHVYLDDKWDREATYNHPTISLVAVRIDPQTNERYTDTLVSVTFQRNSPRAPYSSPDQKHAVGFMRGHLGLWSHGYASRISADTSYLRNLDKIKTGIALIERAQESVNLPSYDDDLSFRDKALGKALNRANDPILSLIVGLRRIGATVVVVNAREWTTKRRPESYVGQWMDRQVG